MKRETTVDAYRIAAALLQYNLDHGLVEVIVNTVDLSCSARTPQEKAAILEAYRKLIESIKRQAR